MRVLLLLPYAWNTAPSQRFRIEQWYPWLKEHGVDLQARTLLTVDQQKMLYSSASPVKKGLMLVRTMAHRAAQLRGFQSFDAVWLHRTAWPVGPAILERKIARSGVPLIYEFDDAIYLADTAAVNRRWGFLKQVTKTDDICRLSSHIVVGNDYLADYARRFNANVTVIPTTIDTDSYRARTEYPDEDTVTVGWSGSRTTVAHLKTLNSALRRVADRVKIRLHVIGTDSYSLDGVETYAADWSPQREIPELNRFDIGVMPLPDEEWARGKCGLKALQYMAVGIPTVVSPVGVNTRIIQDGQNGLIAGEESEWVDKLVQLASNAKLRERLGKAGRNTVEGSYSMLSQAPAVKKLLEEIVSTRLPRDRQSASC